MKKFLKHFGMLVVCIFLATPLALPPPVYASGDYTVKRGDTLYTIALAHHLSLDILVAMNPQITNINMIYPDQKLYVTSSSVIIITNPSSALPPGPASPSTPRPLPGGATTASAVPLQSASGTQLN